MAQKSKYHFLVIKEHSTGRSVVTLPDQKKGFYDITPWVLVKDENKSQQLAKAKKRFPSGTVLITSSLKIRSGCYTASDCFTADNVPVDCCDAIAAYDKYFETHELPTVSKEQVRIQRRSNRAQNETATTLPSAGGTKDRRRDIHRKMSALLSGTSERTPLKLEPLTLEESLRPGCPAPEVYAAFLIPEDGTIKFFQYGTDEYLNFDFVPLADLEALLEDIEYVTSLQERKPGRRLYSLVTWPDCQYLMEIKGFRNRCKLVVPAGHTELDSAYMVPDGFAGINAETHDCYEQLQYPESQRYEGCSPGALSDYEGNIYVPTPKNF